MGRKKLCEEACVHLAEGVLTKMKKSIEVPVGNHDCSNVEVVIQFPELAAVAREEGTAGGGLNTADPKDAELSQFAELLYHSRQAELPDDATAEQRQALWLSCIKAKDKGHTAEPPPEAVAALLEFVAAMPPPEPGKTSAKRIGTGECTVTVRRITSPKRLPKPKPKPPRAAAATGAAP